MYVKKLLAATLAGAVLAGMFSGCNRKIVEHEFHVDTEYVKDYIEKEVTLTFDDFQDMSDSMKKDYGIEFRPDVIYMTETTASYTEEMLAMMGLSAGETSTTTVAELFKRPAASVPGGDNPVKASSAIIVKQTADGVEGYVSACLKGTKTLCDALQILHNGGWDAPNVPLTCLYTPLEIEGKDGIYVLIAAAFTEI